MSSKNNSLSRVARKPVKIASGVKVSVKENSLQKDVTVSGPKGTNVVAIPLSIDFSVEDNEFKITKGDPSNKALAGTMRALVLNAIEGAANSFSQKLNLKGTGYKAQLKGKVLNLALGYSHPIDYNIPENVVITVPSATEVIVSSHDKQAMGAVCAKIASFRPTEPYKGKGVNYDGRFIKRKEVKKK